MKVILLILSAIPWLFSYVTAPPSLNSNGSLNTTSIQGRWRVKFTQNGGEEKNLLFEAKEGGIGSFELLDTGPDNNAVPQPQPATWSITGDNLSIASHVELPLGTCCRETGTLIFKAKALSPNAFSGKLIFVTNIDEEESPYLYHSIVGTFSATRITK